MSFLVGFPRGLLVGVFLEGLSVGFLVNVLVNLSVSLSETPAKSCDRKVTKKRKNGDPLPI